MAHIKKYLSNPFKAVFQKTQLQQALGEPDIDEVSSYIKANMVPVCAGRKCVDGRYLPDQCTGMLSRPGGDCGYVMALNALNNKKKLGFTPDECFNFVFEAITKTGVKFCMHTDDISQDGNIGCGHLACASNNSLSEEYDMPCEDMKHILSCAYNMAEISGGVEIVKLHGNHEEKGMLIIDSDCYTVLPDNPEMHKMYFVYDKKRDNEFLKELVQILNIQGVTYLEMLQESDLQLQATLHNIAGGLPIFHVKFNGDKPVVAFSGFVPQKPSDSNTMKAVNPSSAKNFRSIT